MAWACLEDVGTSRPRLHLGPLTSPVAPPEAVTGYSDWVEIVVEVRGCFLGKDDVAERPRGRMQGACDGFFSGTFRGWSRTQTPQV